MARTKPRIKPKPFTAPIPEGVELPAKFTELREHQAIAIERIMEAYETGYSVVFLDAPVGAGKTIIAESVRQLLSVPSSVYICSSKSLQDQFVADFPYAKVLKGRNNYPTQLQVFPEYTAEDCDKQKNDDGFECTYCHTPMGCSYFVAKEDARASKLAVLNTHYFLAETSLGAASGFINADFVIADECDELENALMGFSEFGLSSYVMQNVLKISPPKKGSHAKTIETWRDEELVPALDHRIRTFRPKSVKDVRSVRRLRRMLDRLKKINFTDDHWVRDNKDRNRSFLMKTFRVSEMGNQLLWKKAQRWLCMSGTILSPDEMASSLGLADGEWTVVKVPMTFASRNRPITYAPVANMSRKGQEAGDATKMGRAIFRLTERYPEENILVHCHSYSNADSLSRMVKEQYPTHRVVTYTNAQDRQDAIDSFRADAPVIVFGASLDRGIDLPGDLCRVQVVAKMPFPYLGDPLIGARMNTDDGQTWYVARTARSLVQSTGRAVRTPTDWAHTYIFDKNFGTWLGKGGKHLLPSWWLDVLKTESVRPWV